MYGLLLVYSKLPRMVQITLMSFAVLKSYSIVPKQPPVIFMCCETLGFESLQKSEGSQKDNGIAVMSFPNTQPEAYMLHGPGIEKHIAER
jgi:hypothetical protein